MHFQYTKSLSRCVLLWQILKKKCFSPRFPKTYKYETSQTSNKYWTQRKFIWNHTHLALSVAATFYRGSNYEITDDNKGDNKVIRLLTTFSNTYSITRMWYVKGSFSFMESSYKENALIISISVFRIFF